MLIQLQKSSVQPEPRRKWSGGPLLYFSSLHVEMSQSRVAQNIVVFEHYFWPSDKFW